MRWGKEIAMIYCDLPDEVLHHATKPGISKKEDPGVSCQELNHRKEQP
jgi:hypothetical protein